MNEPPVKNGIPVKLSPRSIVVRTNLDYKKHYKLVVGIYCKVHYEPDPSSKTPPCTHESIDL